MSEYKPRHTHCMRVKEQIKKAMCPDLAHKLYMCTTNTHEKEKYINSCPL